VPAVALIGTLDTKGDEIAYVRDRLAALGVAAVVIDSGILGEASIGADVSRRTVARAGGHVLEDVQAAGSRGAAVALMREGVREVVVRQFAEGAIQGVLCLGGAEGGLLGAPAMQALPVGVPKLLVSPCASGRRRFGDFVGESDVCVMHSVVDILGLNGISRPIFDNAAAAMAGMVRDAGSALGTLGEHCVGITMLGQTTPGVMRLRGRLVDSGHEPVIFHANGVGGPAMEHLCEEGAIQGVIDYTLSELANALLGGIHTPPNASERLRVAGRLGLPQVVVPGCVDFFNQGPRDTVPERYRDRQSYYHNPVATLVRLTRDEEARLGADVAERLNGATGPVRVVAPTRGFSLADAEGGDLWDPVADGAFLDALAHNLRADIPFEAVDAHVDDDRFADVVADRYLTLVSETADV
jgi:uncharacterized protein (UPF0261 family)